MINLNEPYQLRRPSYNLVALKTVGPSESFLMAIVSNYKASLQNSTHDGFIEQVQNDAVVSFTQFTQFFLALVHDPQTISTMKQGYQNAQVVLHPGQIAIEYLQNHQWRLNQRKLLDAFRVARKSIDMTVSTLAALPDDAVLKQNLRQQFAQKIQADVDLADDADQYQTVFNNLLNNIHVIKANDTNTLQKHSAKLAELAVIFDPAQPGGSRGDYAGSDAKQLFQNLQIVEIDNRYMLNLHQNIVDLSLNADRDLRHFKQYVNEIN